MLSLSSGHLIRKLVHDHIRTHHGIKYPTYEYSHGYGHEREHDKVNVNTHVHVANCNHNSHFDKSPPPPPPIAHQYEHEKSPKFELVTSTTYDKIHFPGPVNGHGGISYGDKGNHHYGASYGDKHDFSSSYDNKHEYGFKDNHNADHNMKGGSSSVQVNANHQSTFTSHSNSMSFSVQKQHNIPEQNYHPYVPTSDYGRPKY